MEVFDHSLVSAEENTRFKGEFFANFTVQILLQDVPELKIAKRTCYVCQGNFIIRKKFTFSRYDTRQNIDCMNHSFHTEFVSTEFVSIESHIHVHV